MKIYFENISNQNYVCFDWLFVVIYQILEMKRKTQNKSKKNYKTEQESKIY